MTLDTEDLSSEKRKLIVHDALVFLSLSLVTVALFVVTLLLFRSFAAHRNALAIRWSGRGKAAIQAGHPEQAISALRTALLYAPDDRSYELLLAQALGDAGHTDESYNYFLSLWDTRPGDGFTNLRLARLAAKKHDQRGAIKYYRAAIYGTWEGDGALRRRDVRLELAQYLLDQHDNNDARTELLIAGGNNPGDPALILKLAGLLEKAGDTTDALTYYKKVITAQPKNEQALAAAGRLQFAAGKYDQAHRLLQQADRETPGTGTVQGDPELKVILQKSERILELSPSKKLPSRVRVERILIARSIAKKRFASCSTQMQEAGASPAQLQVLSSAWISKLASATQKELLQDSDAQDATVKLIFDTETQTSQVCGPPGGDDALLLLLAQDTNSSD